METLETYIDDAGAHRVKDKELVYPVIAGTVAFPLGKKATEAASHRWTVYLRGLNNEDLSHIITRVQFDLHHTFNNANRVVEAQPFEVTEHGWGEFDIVIHLNFTTDSGESEAVMYHKLRLYEDGEPIGVKQDPKRPVVAETYEELVFSEPRLEFYNRIQNYVAPPLNPASQLLPWFRPPSEASELEAIQAVRAKVAELSAELRRELGGAGAQMQGGPGGPIPGMGLQGAPSGAFPPGHMKGGPMAPDGAMAGVMPGLYGSG